MIEVEASESASGATAGATADVMADVTEATVEDVGDGTLSRAWRTRHSA